MQVSDDEAASWDLPWVIDLLRRRYILIISLVLAFTGACFAYSLTLPPQYTAETKVKIDPRQQGAMSGRTLAGLPPDSALVDTELAAMQSPEVARAVARELNLAKDPEFSPKTGGGNVELAAQLLSKSVDIRRGGLTYNVNIRAKSGDPAKAARIANAVAVAYIRISQEQRASLAAEQARALEAELGSLGENVTAADNRVAGVRGEAGIVGSTAPGGTVTDQQITTIAAQLAQADSEAAASSATANAARAQVSSSGIEAVSQVINSVALTELRSQRAQALRDQAQISTNAGPKHPSYIRAEEQLRRINREIAEEASRIVSGMESDARAANARAASLRAQLARLQAQQSGNARASVVADSLQRNADAMRSTYNEMNRIAVQQTQEARVGDVRALIVSRATPPLYPSAPNRMLFLAAGLLLGLGSAAGSVIVLEALSSGLRTADQAERALGISMLGLVPELDAKQLGELGSRRGAWDYVVKRPTSAFAEGLRGVRSALMLSRGRDVPKVITVTSTLPNEGKTTTAISLARVMAMAGDRVLLIDCDLRRNSLAPLKIADSEYGLIEVLEGKCSFDDAFFPDQETTVDVLTLSNNLFTPRDMFSGPEMRNLLASIEERYDFIVLDAPPALALADARMLSAISDATIMAVRSVRTPSKAVKAAISRLHEDGAYIVGAVLTRVSRSHGLSQTDPSYYAKAYRAYYQG